MTRLPVPGADDMQWGDILNDFLQVEHATDGTLKLRGDGTLDAFYSQPTTGIPVTDLANDVQVSLARANAAVMSVNGRSGSVILLKTDVGLGNVDNTADADKPVSTAVQAALNLKATDSVVAHLSGSETLTGKTITSAKYNLLNDANGNTIVVLNAATNAVNYIVFSNAAATFSPILQPNGSDSNISMYIKSRGSGSVRIVPGTDSAQAMQVQNASGSSTVFAVDTTSKRVGVNATAPNSSLHVSGSMATTVVTKTAAYTLTASDSAVFGNASSGAFTLTLPDATTCTGRLYFIKKTDNSANAVTVATTASQTIDGTATKALSAQWKYIKLQSDGSNWQIVGNN